MRPRVTSCGTCAYRSTCGGLDDDQAILFGCFIDHEEPCDFTCPCRSEEFRARLREVGGLESRPWSKLVGPAVNLPLHVPVVRHGYRRPDMLVHDGVVGVSIKDLFGRRRPAAYRPIADTPEELCSKLGLAPGTPLMLVSVAQDRYIERYWAMRNAPGHDLARRIAALKFVAVTIPNFSFFTDAPRTDILFNRKRAMIVAEELSAAGVPVVPHLNAITNADWRFWENVLRSQRLTIVAKEFQTGLRSRDLGLIAIRQLEEVQGRLGVRLHPLVIGGAQYNADFAKRFDSHTVIDSHAFMSSVKRRAFEVRDGRLRRVAANMPVADLLACNLRFYRRHLTDVATSSRLTRMVVARRETRAAIDVTSPSSRVDAKATQVA